jgi:hypothetical protein
MMALASKREAVSSLISRSTTQVRIPVGVRSDDLVYVLFVGCSLGCEFVRVREEPFASLLSDCRFLRLAGDRAHVDFIGIHLLFEFLKNPDVHGSAHT